MKLTKKLASLLLVAVMAMALTIPALAADHTYEIYQIFTGEEYNGTLSNVKWGKNGTGTVGDPVSQTVLDTLATFVDKTDADKLTEITKYVNLDPKQVYKKHNATETSEQTVTDVTPGYYLIKDEDNTQSDGSYTLYVVKVTGTTLTFKPKDGVPTVDKEIVEDGNDVKHNSASIGDTVNYKIIGTMPSNIDAYTTYYYKFSDTLSKGLTFDNNVKVEIGNPNDPDSFTDVTDSFTVPTPTTDETTGAATITIKIENLKGISGVTIDKDTVVVVTYSATLNEKAVIADEGGNTNDVKLIYSNDPNHKGDGASSPKGETPKSEVVTYTTELTITKHDDDGNILPGAEFTLIGENMNIVLVTEEVFIEDANGGYYKLANGKYTTTPPASDTDPAYVSPANTQYAKEVKITSKGNGKTDTTVVGTVSPLTGELTFTGLGAGHYVLKETKTPAGYNTIKDIGFTIKVEFDSETGAPTFSVICDDKSDIISIENNMLFTTVVNKAGVKLPETGGIGTTIFYTLGAVLVVGAGVLLVTKKRMDTEK